MKIKFFLLSVLLLAINFSYSQISLPKGFRCVSMSRETNMRDSYFSDGVFRFHSEAWGRDFQDPSELVAFIKKNYGSGFNFKKTRDNLYWATGVFSNEYKYIIIIPSELTTIVLSSKANNSQFSNYSAWLLQQTRINISSGKDYYFTDYLGKECL